ncbi:hypothetical protein NDU88_005880 [Pleurodeles waltl]|uniref:Uncharacterized protein n=1 Tax=Pleurodeles waltl TaxID=8319 RepID=A0AAV7MKR1_PLEWA|nr:hypothetical protein NDU88_005880 [Pleurodeles waltl]
MLWHRVATLGDHQVESQAKQEDLENRSNRCIIHIQGVPRGAEGDDIMAFTTELLQMIRDVDDPPLALDKAHQVSSVPSRPN